MSMSLTIIRSRNQKSSQIFKVFLKKIAVYNITGLSQFVFSNTIFLTQKRIRGAVVCKKRETHMLIYFSEIFGSFPQRRYYKYKGGTIYTILLFTTYYNYYILLYILYYYIYIIYILYILYTIYTIILYILQYYYK